jgi:hypothetical protein
MHLGQFEHALQSGRLRHIPKNIDYHSLSQHFVFFEKTKITPPLHHWLNISVCQM